MGLVYSILVQFREFTVKALIYLDSKINAIELSLVKKTRLPHLLDPHESSKN